MNKTKVPQNTTITEVSFEKILGRLAFLVPIWPNRGQLNKIRDLRGEIRPPLPKYRKRFNRIRTSDVLSNESIAFLFHQSQRQRQVSKDSLGIVMIYSFPIVWVQSSTRFAQFAIGFAAFYWGLAALKRRLFPFASFANAMHGTHKYFIITSHKARGWKRGVTSINAINYTLRGFAMNREEVIYYG